MGAISQGPPAAGGTHPVLTLGELIATDQAAWGDQRCGGRDFFCNPGRRWQRLEPDQRVLEVPTAAARKHDGATKDPMQQALRPLIRLRRPPKRTFPFGRKPRAKESPALIANEARLVRNNRSVS
jgi:hypothetical protein